MTNVSLCVQHLQETHCSCTTEQLDMLDSSVGLITLSMCKKQKKEASQDKEICWVTLVANATLAANAIYLKNCVT